MSAVKIERLTSDDPRALAARRMIESYENNELFFKKNVLNDPRYLGKKVVIGAERVLAVGPLDYVDSRENRQFYQDFENARRELKIEEWNGIYWGRVLPRHIEQ